jgi:hypothetical protein
MIWKWICDDRRPNPQAPGQSVLVGNASQDFTRTKQGATTMDHKTNEQETRSTEGGQVTWSDKTRGGFWVRGIYPFNSDGYGYDLRGQVGNHSDQPPSKNPADWYWETWHSDGRYNNVKESVLDLVEVRGE